MKLSIAELKKTFKYIIVFLALIKFILSLFFIVTGISPELTLSISNLVSVIMFGFRRLDCNGFEAFVYGLVQIFLLLSWIACPILLVAINNKVWIPCVALTVINAVDIYHVVLWFEAFSFFQMLGIIFNLVIISLTIPYTITSVLVQKQEQEQIRAKYLSNN